MSDHATGKVRIPCALSQDVSSYFSDLRMCLLEEAAEHALRRHGGKGNTFIDNEDLIEAARATFASAADEFAQSFTRESDYVRATATSTSTWL